MKKKPLPASPKGRRGYIKNILQKKSDYLQIKYKKK